MKKLILLLSILFLSSPALAEECYFFDVREYSKKLSALYISVHKPLIGSARAVVSGFDGQRTIRMKFSCQQGRHITTCVQKGGGGEFLLKRGGRESAMKLAYMNLQIDAEGEDALKPGEEIGEDFAVLDLKNKDNESDGGELRPVLIQGQRVRCGIMQGR